MKSVYNQKFKFLVRETGKKKIKATELGTKSLSDKISSTKHQITNNFQITNSNFSNIRILLLEFSLYVILDSRQRKFEIC